MLPVLVTDSVPSRFVPLQTATFTIRPPPNLPLNKARLLAGSRSAEKTALGTAYVAFFRAGQRSAAPERLTFGRPGERPLGFGTLAGVPTRFKSVAKPRRTLLGVSERGGSGFSQGKRWSGTTPAPDASARRR
jgi:hypothetical protein